jgi:hypothetical protein
LHAVETRMHTIDKWYKGTPEESNRATQWNNNAKTNLFARSDGGIAI